MNRPRLAAVSTVALVALGVFGWSLRTAGTADEPAAPQSPVGIIPPGREEFLLGDVKPWGFERPQEPSAEPDAGDLSIAEQVVREGGQIVPLETFDTTGLPPRQWPEAVPFATYDGTVGPDGFLLNPGQSPPRGPLDQLIVERTVLAARPELTEALNEIAADREARVEALRDAGRQIACDRAYWRVNVDWAAGGGDGGLSVHLLASAHCPESPPLWGGEGLVEELWSVAPDGRPTLESRVVLSGLGASDSVIGDPDA